MSPEANLAAMPAFLLLHPKDNVLVCTLSAAAGDRAVLDGIEYLLSSDIALGHKIARFELKTGDKVYRYGVSIGSMTASALPGDHVHRHNLASNYISAHDRAAARTQGILS